MTLPTPVNFAPDGWYIARKPGRNLAVGKRFESQESAERYLANMEEGLREKLHVVEKETPAK